MPSNKERFVRDTGLYVSGLMGVAHEVLLRDDVREGILILLGGMLGLPAIMKQDEKRNKSKEDDLAEAGEGP